MVQVCSEFPDGEHTCVLTRRKFQAENGCIYNLELAKGEVGERRL
ncbi:MAG: hypothetical protein ACFB02_01120 [Mastigocoleus sp.]